MYSNLIIIASVLKSLFNLSISKSISFPELLSSRLFIHYLGPLIHVYLTD